MKRKTVNQRSDTRAGIGKQWGIAVQYARTREGTSKEVVAAQYARMTRTREEAQAQRYAIRAPAREKAHGKPLFDY